ncbi:nuclear transport factor 2 family protein [Alkalihalobacillus sp. 1P02AB]|uniref:nuclear transport factor 2 family protein n=1 Tax=Alkalihalobacillus sp. 1P02AB TaxID=3132260 RepID=UPI0039A6DDCE
MIISKLNEHSLEIISPNDCSNSPKREQLRDFNIAFAKADIESIVSFVADDITWNMVSENQTFQGKAAFVEVLEQMKEQKATKLEISQIITHGKTGATNGVLTFGEQKYGFCDVYVFTGAGKDAKLKEITSYVLNIS